jgi:hypothetical protein
MQDLGLIIAIVGSSVALVGTVIALFLWNRSEASADRRDIVNLIIAIKEEMKDFHGRLERQDAEFRTRLLGIEEKRIR